MKRRVQAWLVAGATVLGSAVGRAADKHVEPAQLVTYVKPMAPASVTEAHSVAFVGTLGKDGMLHELAAVDAADALASAAKDAAVQWVYVPFKERDQAVTMPVYLMVAVGGAEHVTMPKEPVLLSTRVAGLLVVKRVAANSPQPGARGMVPVAATLGRDGLVKKAQGMSGPEIFRAAAERAVKESSYRVVLLDGVPVEVGTTIPTVVGQ